LQWEGERGGDREGQQKPTTGKEDESSNKGLPQFRQQKPLLILTSDRKKRKPGGASRRCGLGGNLHCN